MGEEEGLEGRGGVKVVWVLKRDGLRGSWVLVENYMEVGGVEGGREGL